MKRISLLGMLALVTACARGTEPSGHAAQLTAAPNSRAAMTSEPLQTFYGPERFTRSKGAPDAVQRSIATHGFAPPFVLHVRNGAADGGARVSSAVIIVDGRQLLGTRDFSEQVDGHDLEVDLGSTASLSVKLAGAPGSFVEISIAGRRATRRVCPAEPGAYNTLADVLVDAPAGATIQFCDGRHSVQDVLLGSKAITLEAEHPLAATLDAGGATGNISIGSPEPWNAPVTIRGFVFVNAATSNVTVHDNHGPVLISDSEFHPREASPYGGELSYNAGVGVFGSTAPVTVENSRFLGGDIGVHENNGSVSILNSEFQAQTNAAIHGGGGGGVLHAEGNAITGCGLNWSIGVFGGATTRLLNNSITIAANRPVVNVMQVFQGTYEIVGNDITGEYDPAKKTIRYPIRSNAISINGSGTVNANRITGVENAFDFQEGPGVAEDNVVSAARTVIAFSNHASWQVHRNDIVDYEQPFWFVFDAPNASATCNWWGSVTGPGATNAPTEYYEPWATEPIAGTDVSCE